MIYAILTLLVILAASNADPHEQLAAWGLTAKDSELGDYNLSLTPVMEEE